MLDSKQLLSDLQDLLRKQIEPDLRDRSEQEHIKKELTTEFEAAKKAERTALNYTDWRADYITQIGAAWVLSCVFVRFLEDNDLIDPPKLSGPTTSASGKQAPLQRARDEYDLYIKKHPEHSFREYILSVVDQLAKLPGGKEVFGPNNIIHQQRGWLSNDAAKVLYNFWQRIEPETGELVHEFNGQRSAVSGQEERAESRQLNADSYPDTRFLGDLYQDLSEAARKKYALLQTPDFVEEFILDRTLDPALEEFGLTPGIDPSDGEAGSSKLTADSYFKLIDPACGSGHFLLGAFPRILDRWQRKEPGTKTRELVQRTLHSIHGVDINPFAIAIARFRLLLAALAASGVRRLADAPAYAMNLACGDSLYHGVERQQTLGDWTDESHYFRTEDADNLRRILQEGTFHAVVANPPYITVKDAAANLAYRRLYTTCHRKYSLSVPFMERIFRLAIRGDDSPSHSGWTGQITSNSFTKREFGKPLIEEFFQTVDITHIIDTSGAYIPGHGTPTVILIGQNRRPVGHQMRTVMGVQGEPVVPADPSSGLVWTAITTQIDEPDTDSTYVSVRDTPRAYFAHHPWSMGGGGASELKRKLEDSSVTVLHELATAFGYLGITADDAMIADQECFRRRVVEGVWYRGFMTGDHVRDWCHESGLAVLFPYGDELLEINSESGVGRWLWPCRTTLGNRPTFAKQTYFQEGRPWWEWHQVVLPRLQAPHVLIYPSVTSYVHFIARPNAYVFNRHAPMVVLEDSLAVNAANDLRGLLNSSVAAFWLKQVMSDKGNGGIGGGIANEQYERIFEYDGSKLKKFPIPSPHSLSYVPAIDRVLSTLACSGAKPTVQGWPGLKATSSTALVICLEQARQSWIRQHQSLFRLQEDLDWECYRLYGLLEDDLTYGSEESLGIQLGERAFEIVMARKMAASELTTTWFERHGSQPITELPSHWPDDYRQLVQRRIDIIESNPQIALIEQPEYKRRWNTTPWEEQVEKALKSWLLDRLESYFDFDGRMSESDQRSAVSGPQEQEEKLNAESSPPPLADIQLVPVAQLADVASNDSKFMEVAKVYRDNRSDFDLVKLVAELVCEEHVPALPVLRYKPSGLDKRVEWEQTWDLQRKEDEISARVPEFGLREALSSADESSDLESQPVMEHQVDREAMAELVIEFRRRYDITTEESDPEEDIAEAIKTALLEVKDLKVRDVQRVVCQQVLGEIPVPPKYASKDFISSGGAKYWKLRGKLDVPKERWVSFPHCQGEDQTLVIAWAGYDHLQLTKAIAAYFAEVQEHGGSEDPRLVPLLAAMDQQIPWVKQWHNEVDPEYGYRLGDYFESFIADEARALNKSVEDIRNWQPPSTTKKKKSK